MKKKKVVKIIVWSAVAVLVGGYFGMSAYQKANFLPTVRAGTVSREDIDAYLSSTATIASSDSVTYYAPPNSQVLAVHFQQGDTVQKGDMIAEFDLTDLNNEIRQAQLTLSDRQLSVNGAAVGVSDAQTQLEQAQKDLEQQPEIDKINAEIQEYQDEIAAYEARIRKVHREDEYPGDSATGSGYQLDEEDWQDEQRWQGRIEQYTREISRLNAELSGLPKTEDMQRKTAMAENAVKTAQNSLLTAKNAQASASINLQSLQRYQQDKGIVAQESGVVTELGLVEGALSTNTAAALTVQNTDHLRATFKISKYDIGTIQVGQDVTLSLGELSYTGQVSKISGSAVKEQSASGSGTTAAQVPAEVTIDNPDDKLVIGLDFDMEIHTFSQKNALSIPVEAVMTDRSGDFCYLLTPSTEREGAYQWTKTYIQTGKSSDLYIEVLSGVNEGDTVVMNPSATLDTTPIVLVDTAEMDAAANGAEGETVPASTDGTSAAPASVSSEASDASSASDASGESADGSSEADIPATGSGSQSSESTASAS